MPGTDDLSLGIPGVGPVRPGTHFCALYSGPAERDRLLFPFLEEGLRHGDKCLCLIDDVEPALVRDRVLGQPGPGYAERSAQLDVERASDVYLRSGEFTVADMTDFLSESVDSAMEDEFDLLRAAGEMSWVLPGPPGRDELFSYESGLNHLVEEVPAILICLFDLQKFGADMLVEVLRTHPKVLLDRTVIDNPHYVPPQRYRRPAPTPTPTAREVEVDRERMDARWHSLTGAELRVASCVARGMTNRAIAEELIVSRHTVDAHLKHVFVKLEIHSRVELAVQAMQRGLARA
ncbi:MEDS domain-containing protein [Nocardioides sp. CFH 31398]|uniref:MEDS domain-containing protein n=1 Tax=Nocardioides sp. CFH 31398 TaxID=2919579 RepID=UPI001F05A956|nr:MEDS domain-containing protein [Nocardioides sp. CFH 31398]MCH1866522.1 MEDS domain-containing protein [Nocardioides sp. CFH 31398]